MNKNIKNLFKEIEVIINTPPLEITINSPQISNYKKSLEKIEDRNLNVKNSNIKNKLSDMGLSNSSTALGAEISLARERAQIEMDIEQKVNEYAIKEKESVLSQKQSILATLTQEEDKKYQRTSDRIKLFFNSVVIVALINTFAPEIKKLLIFIIALFQ